MSYLEFVAFKPLESFCLTVILVGFVVFTMIWMENWHARNCNMRLARMAHHERMSRMDMPPLSEPDVPDDDDLDEEEDEEEDDVDDSDEDPVSDRGRNRA